MLVHVLVPLFLEVVVVLASTVDVGAHDLAKRFDVARLPADVAYLVDRALPNSPSGNYTPKVVSCPSKRPTIRSAAELSPSELEWIPVRRNNTVKPMIEFLKRSNISGLNVESYINKAASSNVSALPNIAIAVSGGGYRALMNGAGFVKAADSRTPGSTDKGGIGGLLQSSTYLAGLSGGGWLVGSIFANNFSSVDTLQQGSKGSSVWQFANSIFEGPEESGLSIFNTVSYWDDVADQVSIKADSGFETSITDYWGRALSYQLVNATDGGPAYTFSSIALTDNFKKGETPFPLLVADGRAPDEVIVSLNATNFEFNPFEMGSFDPTVYGFVPTRYIASNFTNGKIEQSGHCVEGFDQIGFVMGTSSSLFNQFLLKNLSSMNIPKPVVSVIEGVLKALGENNNDIAQYLPNPFLDWNEESNPGAKSRELSLVDGGEDLQNIPLTPLLQPSRVVDVIFAVDSSADTTYSWPNATALRATYDRSLSPIANGTGFPPVPDANTFINLGLNYRPTFFGCDASNFTNDNSSLPPLIVYIPNAPYTTLSNVSTFDPSYSNDQRNDIILNALNGATQGNGTLDAQWQTCVSCAVLSRSLHRTGTDVPSECTDCFKRYCWDGKLDTAAIKGDYEPAFKIGDQTTQSGAVSQKGVMGSSALAMVVAGLAASLLV